MCHINVVAFLLVNGADPLFKLPDDATPMHHALSSHTWKRARDYKHFCQGDSIMVVQLLMRFLPTGFDLKRDLRREGINSVGGIDLSVVDLALSRSLDSSRAAEIDELLEEANNWSYDPQKITGEGEEEVDEVEPVDTPTGTRGKDRNPLATASEFVESDLAADLAPTKRKVHEKSDAVVVEEIPRCFVCKTRFPTAAQFVSTTLLPPMLTYSADWRPIKHQESIKGRPRKLMRPRRPPARAKRSVRASR